MQRARRDLSVAAESAHTPAIIAVSRAFEAAGLRPEVGPMSAMESGEAVAVFSALEDADVRWVLEPDL